MPKSSKLWLQLLSLGGAGVVLIIVAALVHAEVIKEVLLGFGVAVLTASLLGFTVDVWLKRKLTEDAFRAAFGYLLPEALRGELAWVFEMKLLVTDHMQEIRLVEVEDSDLLCVEIRVERRLRNISREKQDVPLRFNVDEWHRPGHPSRVIAMEGIKDGKKWSEFQAEQGPYSIGAKMTEPITLAPGESLFSSYIGEEFHEANGEHGLTLTVPTQNPRVRVVAPPGVEWVVNFGNREAGSVVRVGTDTDHLSGTLLPYQTLSVRWWRAP